MEKRHHTGRRLLAALALFAYLFTCAPAHAEADEHTPGEVALIRTYEGASPEKLVEEIIIEAPPSPVELNTKVQLSARVLPDDAANKTVTWACENRKIAEVLPNDQLLATVPGFALVTATAEDGSGVSANITIQIGRPVTGVSISEPKLTIKVGEMAELKATVVPEDASFPNLSFIVDDSSIAQVFEGGTILGVSPGTTTVSANATDLNGASATCEVTVIRPVEKIAISAPDSLKVGETAALGADVYPSFATVKTLIWSSGNPSVASVDDSGVVSALAAGDAVITAAAADGSGVTGEKKIAVIQPVTSIELTAPYNALSVGSQMTVSAAALPSDASDKMVHWSSSDESIAKVDGEGNVTAISPGAVTITATANDGNGALAEMTLTVIRLVSSIELTAPAIAIDVGSRMKLNATALPSDASDKSMNWRLSDESIAAVDGDGIVTALTPGAVTVTAMAGDGGGASAALTLTVVRLVKSIELSSPAATVYAGDRIKLSALALPADASNPNILWSSSDESIAKVDKSGNVMAIEPGKVNITATAEDGGGVFETTELTIIKNVASISITAPADTMNVGSQLKLSAQVLPANATNKAIVWSSGDTSIATVDSDGCVKALETGVVAIVAATLDGSGVLSVKMLTVVRPVSSISLSAPASSIFVSGQVRLSASVLPSNATNKGIAWSSGDTSIATVDASGNVVAVKPGTVKITAKAIDGSGTFASKELAVIQPVSSISITASTSTVFVAGQLKLTATALPANAANKSVKWSSYDPSIATVDASGNVKALKIGKVKIAATAQDLSGTFAVQEITVVEPVQSIALSASQSTINVGSALKINAEVKPESAANKGLNWKSSNASVASVDASGNVVAVKPGKVKITAEARDLSGVFAAIEVTIVQAVTSVKLAATASQIKVGGTVKISATVLPANATNMGLTWSSSNPPVATVDQTGRVTAKSPGKTTITATAKDGGGAYATKEVTAVQPVTSVTLNLQKLTISVGQTVNPLKAGALPANASNKAVTYSVDKPSILTVGKNGAITGIWKGTATVKITAADGSGKTASCVVKVVDKKKGVTSISLSKKSANVQQGKTVSLKANLKPSGAKDKAVQWMSSDKTVATVSSKGVVKGIKPGKAVITATASSGYTAECTVTVTEVPVSKLTMKKNSASVKLGKKYRLLPTVAPVNAGNKSLTWTSSNEKVATVDQDGWVKAVGAGKAKITARSANGKSASYTLTVKK